MHRDRLNDPLPGLRAGGRSDDDRWCYTGPGALQPSRRDGSNDMRVGEGKKFAGLSKFRPSPGPGSGPSLGPQSPPPRTDCFAILAPLSRYYMYKHYKVYDWARYQGEHGSFSTFNGEPTTNFCAEIPLETIVSGCHIRYIANIFVYLLY